MRKIFIISLLSIFAFSCKKQPTTWESDWTAPVAYGHLTINDMLSSEYIETNSDNYLSLVYHKAIYSFSIDTLVDLPDTTIIKKSAVGVASLTVNPGFSYLDSYNQLYDLDQIELKKVVVKSGNLEVLIKCPWQGNSIVTFTFPKITLLGQPFVRTYQMAAASLVNPSIAQETIDLSNFEMDLTGTSGNLFNTLSANFEMGSNESVNSFTVTDTDSVEYIISFKSLVPLYAKGYFGQYSFADTIGFSLDFMKNITAGQINIDSLDLNITIKNGFNLVAQAKITKLTGINSNTNSTVDLNFPLLNSSLNINPATGGFYSYTPSQYPISINNVNSNIAPFVENLSDSLLLGYELDINPFGNVSGGSDEIFPGSTMELFLDAEFPLYFGASGVTLVDTFKINYERPNGVMPTTGNFVLKYTNAFPLEAQAKFYMLNESGAKIDSVSSSTFLNAGAYNSTTQLTSNANGSVVYNLSASNILNLELASHVVLNIIFSTDQAQMVKIDANSFFDFSLISNLNIKAEF